LGYSVRSLEVVRRLSSPASPWRFLSAARPGRMRHDAVTVFARTRLSAVRFTSAHPTPPSPPSLVARVLAPSCSSERKSRSAPRAMQMCGSAARLLSNRKGFGVISMRIARSRAKPERLRRALLLFPLSFTDLDATPAPFASCSQVVAFRRDGMFTGAYCG
jgi:hypothetical protein